MDDHRLGDSIREFLNKRRHPDGGYTLFEGLPDTKNTYYALRSFELLGDEPGGLEKTLDWLEDVHSRGSFAAQGLFYRCSVLRDYGRDFLVSDKFIDLLKASYRKSKLEITYYMDSVLRMHGEYLEEVPEWVLSQQNPDGGFGRYGSDIINTYFAVEVLRGHGVDVPEGVLEFTDGCFSGGVWNFTPISYPPYIETVHAGFRINEMLRGSGLDVSDFVMGLRNPDGGFRRSVYMGISEPEYTYRALYMIIKSKKRL